jgi:hypothetical protein
MMSINPVGIRSQRAEGCLNQRTVPCIHDGNRRISSSSRRSRPEASQSFRGLVSISLDESAFNMRLLFV